MPKVTIDVVTTPEEQDTVYKAIVDIVSKEDCSKGISVSRIAKKAHMSTNRVRYVVDDLVDNGRIERFPVKAYNEHYIRYGYAPNKKEV